jgi:acetyl-CoA carboxylase biotin carboxyl carrier protein
MVAQDLLELEVKDGDFHLRLSRGKPQAAPVYAPPPPAAPAPEAATEEEAPPSVGHSVASPLAGMFYRSPSPASPSFVKEGDKVAFGDMLCIVEAMKVMNEIRADRPCVIKKILVENGKPVSAGQNLFLVEPVA